MGSFNLDTLLHSNNFVLTASNFRPGRIASRNERLVWKDSFGPLKVSRVSFGSSYVYRISLGDKIKVDVMPAERLAVYSRSDVPKITIDHFLVDQVLPRVMSQQGELILHAGAVRNKDGAILLLGPSGRGKSTLATSFHDAGWALMGDDAAVISWEEGKPSACAIYPSLRLFPDSIEALVSDSASAESLAHYTSKQRLNLPTLAEAVSQPSPIKAIFVLAEPSEGGRIDVHRLSIADACMSLLKNSFALDPTDPEQARQRLDQASKLAHRLPTFAISYPHDYARLPEVRKAIEAAAP